MTREQLLPDSSPPIILTAADIHKSFGGVRALNGVSLALAAGSVTEVAGDYAYVARVGAHIVISETAERFMISVPTDDYDIVRDEARRGQNDPSAPKGWSPADSGAT